MSKDVTIRVLVVDDEPHIREAYRELLAPRTKVRPIEAERLRTRLFDKGDATAAGKTTFEIETADGAEAGVEAVRARLASGTRFDLVFLDMRMPPGPDGAWAASAIRASDPDVDIVLATAYSDVDPGELSARIPPAERLFYLQKPFLAHEVHQLAVALGRKSHAEQAMRRLAYFDALTGLPNREQARDQMSRFIELARRHKRKLAVMFIDLDHFKRINDTLGHNIGDEVLRAVAQRFRKAVRETDMVSHAPCEVARLCGDEFLVLLPEIASGDDARVAAQRIVKSLEAPLKVGTYELHIAPTIGISIYPEDGEDIDALLRSADLAMYFAKATSRGGFQYFDAAMKANALSRLTIENQLRGAIDRGEFFLEYQPQIDLRSGRVSSMECLLRWKNCELGSIAPLDFIPVAEESGLIVPIGDWVLHAACAQASTWIAAGLKLTRMSVNISGVQLKRSDFIERIAHALEQSKLEASVLELELTETTLIANLDHARELLTAIKALGVQIAIDDFGVGYSNLSHLRSLPIDRLKIDRSFVSGIATNDKDRAIAAAVIAMASSMNLRVTAEGIEDDGQLDILGLQGCDDGQGYFIASPMAPESASDYLRAFGVSADAASKSL